MNIVLGTTTQSKLKLKSINFRSGAIRYISSGDQAEYAFDKTDPFSASAWVKFTSTGLMVIGGKLAMTLTYDRGWDIRLFNGNFAFFIAGDYETDLAGNPITTDFLYVVGLGVSLNDDHWHHVVATYDGTSLASGVKLYADGVSLTTSTPLVSGPLVLTTLNVGELQWSGRQIIPGRQEFTFTGAMSDMAVYNKVLSGAEVTTVYDSHCPPRLEAVGPVANLVGFWRPNLTDAYPTLVDLSTAAHNATMTNMASGDIYSR